ncbi:MAG: phospholipase [Flavobacteriaceae bacterium]|nr:phospholipase [Flavobacteriaceae bacterium]
MLQTDLSLNYLYKPAHKNIKKPVLMLLLHGYGSNEADLFSFADQLPDNFFIISVRAPRSLPYGGFAWYDINFMDAQKFNNVEQAQQSISLIRQFIAECIDNHDLNPDQVWLTGFSQGAILSYALTLQQQQNIKRVICLSGYPSPDIIGDKLQGEYIDLQFFISHGVEDTVIPIDWARQADQWLNQLKIPHVYKEYRSGHGIVPQNFYDMLDWIEQVK